MPRGSSLFCNLTSCGVVILRLDCVTAKNLTPARDTPPCNPNRTGGNSWARRRLTSLSLSSLAIGAADPKPPGTRRPVVIASGNLKTVEIAMEMIKKGADPLDAVIAGVAIVEADPNDHSVGLGGTPNEDGVVELDASVMHGRTHGGAGVAGLRNIVHPAAVARTIMKKTRHVLLVGDNAAEVRQGARIS